MHETNSICSIQKINFAVTFIKKKIHIKNLDHGQQSEEFEECQGPGHFSVDIKSVVSLDLSRCNLRELPDCLKQLPLKVLNISFNSISNVPKCILDGLPFVEELYYNHNGLTSFDVEPACCLRLRILDISENLIKHLPPWIIHVRAINLKELNYSKNLIGCTDDAMYHKIATYNLEKLVLHSCQVANRDIPFIKSIRRLKSLDLSNNEAQIYQNCLSYWDQLFDKPSWDDRLEILNFNRLYMSFLPENISNIINLKEIYLTFNDLYWLPESFCELKNLEILDLSRNLLCNLPNSFPNLKRLKILKLQFNQLSRVDQVYEFSNLEILDLYSNEIDEFNGELKNYIDLEQNNLSTDTFPVNYYEKKKLYRMENSLHDRIDGKRENLYGSDHESMSDTNYSILSEEGMEYPRVDHCLDCEENWDLLVKETSHPDITFSDDEWDGTFKLYAEHEVMPTVSKSVKMMDLYELYRDAEEW